MVVSRKFCRPKQSSEIIPFYGKRSFYLIAVSVDLSQKPPIEASKTIITHDAQICNNICNNTQLICKYIQFIIKVAEKIFIKIFSIFYGRFRSPENHNRSEKNSFLARVLMKEIKQQLIQTRTGQDFILMILNPKGVFKFAKQLSAFLKNSTNTLSICLRAANL